MPKMAAIAVASVLATQAVGAQALPELLLQAEAQTLTGTCTGQPVRLEGNHNTVTLSGACGSLLLKGVSNTVAAGVVPGASIHVEGSGNRVTYAVTGAPPVIVMLGPDNDVLSGAEPAVQQPKPPVPPPLAAPAPPQVQASTGPLTLAGDDQQRLADCAGRDVAITGERSAYVLRGGCKSVTLRGDLLTVQAELVPGARVTVTGRGSIVSWAFKASAAKEKGRAPVTTATGEGSRVQRVDMIGGEAVAR